MSYIGTQPTPQSLESRQEFTATASQTTFATSGYTVGYVDVYLNGVKLSTSDFTATNGSDVVLGSGAAAGDVLAVVMKNDHSDLVALPITDSQGNNVLSESAGVVTLTADTAIIEGSSSGDLVRITQTGSGNALVVEDSTNPDSTPFVVDASGKVGIGTSPSVKLDIEDTSSNPVIINSTNANGGYVEFQSSGSTVGWVGSAKSLTGATGSATDLAIRSDNNVVFANGGSEKVRIDVSGNVKINTLGSGDVYATSGTLYISSDIRLKNDLGVIDESAIEIIKQLTPRYYSWKNDESSRQQLGFFAQEVFPILPEAVPRDLKYEQNGIDENGQPILEQVLDENGEPDYQWGFATQPIVAMLVKAIQEQQTIIESQQAQIDALTARIEALEATP